MSNTDPLPSIARAILSGAAEQLIHGTICDDKRLSLRVSRDGKRRRLQCVNCNQFVELPVGEDYDLAWIEVGQEPLLERLAAMPAPSELSKNTGVCSHGVPMARECPLCAAEPGAAQFEARQARPLNGRIEPPNMFNGEGL